MKHLSSFRRPVPSLEPSDRVLLALQYWEGDRAQAMDVARFIADLQPKHTDAADFLFVSRFDCHHDQDAVKYVSNKFNVRTFTSRRRGKGWPHGCNDLWFSTIEHVNDNIEIRKFPKYKFVLTFEADCVPMSTRWIQHLIEQWDLAQAKRRVFVMGAQLESPGRHINGNALFSTDQAFTRWLSKDVSAAPPSQGWDYYLGPSFRSWGVAIMPGLQSFWATPTFSETDIENSFGRGDVFVHGVKDRSLLHAARKKLL